MPVTVEIVGLDALQAHLTAMREGLAVAPRRIVMEYAKVLKREMVDEAPVRTGALRRGIHYRTEGAGETVTARFYDDEDYTPFVIHGTAPHDIYPVHAKALFWPGAAHPVAFVHHPGTKADDFPGRAFDRTQGEIDAILEETGQLIVEAQPVDAAATDDL